MKKIFTAGLLITSSIFCNEINAQTGNYFAGYNCGGTRKGSYITGVGYNVMRNENEGYRNTAFGSYAMEYANTGSYNTAVGAFSLNQNNTGVYNTCVGVSSMLIAKASSFNTAIGGSTLINMISGEKNTAVGYGALAFQVNNTSSASSNTAIGYQALSQNINGASNISVGAESLYSNFYGNNNVAAGNLALYFNRSGSYNVALGPSALYYNVDGISNVAIGINAGKYLQLHANNNTFLGTNADATIQTYLSNATAIGNGAKVNASNKVRIGNSSVTVIGGAVNWSITTAPAPFIANKKENVPGLLFINKLKPVTYTVDEERFAKFLGMEDSVSDTEQKFYSIASKKWHSGFMPQEVEKTAKEIGYDFEGIKAPQNEKDNYSIAYADFVPSLVKAVQELSKQNDELKNQNEKIKTQNTEQQNSIIDLQKQIDELKAMLMANAACVKSNQQFVLNAPAGAGVEVASLQQNAPNPFSQNTVIKYFIPQQTNNAVIKITNANGVEIKSFTPTQKGNGQITIEAGALAAGTYYYSLIIDGKNADTKKMQLVK